ncbi:hypothetical protein P035_01958 [Brucella suis 06-988-1656]|nr:YtcJ-like metal-dependent amidohydrolase [Brucella suis bv. 2]ENR25167.1 tat (twin-arginine translocation) pathway signal sequence [Brucella suis 94/11]ENR31872.1 tat (twin-arginine translocation) pathway signal sequence [Brucella suis F4/06-146]ENR33189.1 tat (twin-arginine translocation) pathway signal sequence [Brucella suis F5/03-2]ENR38898.1 tat (twin-arginine translocation) pathway signal sequence [Brucella suis F8/06-2]ENT31877.1 tat (twin-arginine translocation) pathway signal seque
MCLMCGPAAKTILNITRRNLLKGLGAASLTAAIPFRAESADSEPGQIVFFGGPIITVEPGAEQVEAVAVTNGVISAAGSKAEILDKKATDVLLVDLKGRTLLPGFHRSRKPPHNAEYLSARSGQGG